MDRWTEPVVAWETGIDSRAHHGRLAAAGERLATWPPAPFEQSPTDCFRVGPDYWIWQPGVGGIRFRADHPAFLACPSPEVDASWFEHLITFSWLPAVFHVWGRQVLHASAVCCRATGEVAAFVGPSGAGKSTMAYGLAQRPGWRQVSDDTLAFSIEGPPHQRRIELHRLRNDARLRPATAAHFGQTTASPEPVVWPAGSLRLARLYFLAGHQQPGDHRAATIEPLRPAESYPRLLGQAHALTLDVPEHNRRLMQDYLHLAATLPAFTLTFRRSFASLEAALDLLSAHGGATAGSSASSRVPFRATP